MPSFRLIDHSRFLPLTEILFLVMRVFFVYQVVRPVLRAMDNLACSSGPHRGVSTVCHRDIFVSRDNLSFPSAFEVRLSLFV